MLHRSDERSIGATLLSSSLVAKVGLFMLHRHFTLRTAPVQYARLALSHLHYGGLRGDGAELVVEDGLAYDVEGDGAELRGVSYHGVRNGKEVAHAATACSHLLFHLHFLPRPRALHQTVDERPVAV